MSPPLGPSLRLGVRLAVGTTLGTARLRAGLTIGTAAFGTLVLLATLAIAHAEASGPGGPLDTDHQILLAAVVSTLGLPVVMLLISVSRLSASMRDRRLAALRLLGLSPGQTRMVATAEAGVLAIAGAALGAGLFWAVRPAVGVLSLAGRHWTSATFVPGLWQFAAAVVGVPVMVVLVALAPTRAVTVRPLAVRRTAMPRRPSMFRLVPVLAGAGCMAWLFTIPQDDFASPTLSQFWPFLAGAVLGALGLPFAVPVLVRSVADLLARLTRRPALLVAARRLQVEPATTTRLVSGLLIAVFVVTGARCVITAWERTPQYIEAYRAEVTGPQMIPLSGSPGDRPADLRQLATKPYVRRVIAFDFFSSDCSRPKGRCIGVFVGTCAKLAELLPVRGCRDDAVEWIRETRTGHSGTERDLPPGAPLVLRRDGSKATLRVAAPSSTIAWTDDPDDPFPTSMFLPGLFLPSSVPGSTALVDPGARSYVVYADPGERTTQAVIDVAQALHPDGLSYAFPDFGVLRQVAGYKSILWTVTAIVVLVGLTAFGIAAIDRAVERRREIAALHVLGSPAGLARASQLLQSLIPLGLGIPLAGGLGFLAGTGYLAFDEIRAYTPWQSVLTLTAAAVAAAVLVAASTVAGSGGINPALLRRE